MMATDGCIQTWTWDSKEKQIICDPLMHVGLLTIWALCGLVAKWQHTFEIWCRKTGQIVVFLHLPNVFSFQSISSYILFFFSETFLTTFCFFLTYYLSLCKTSAVYWKSTLKISKKHTFLTKPNGSLLSVHETYCKLRQQTPVTRRQERQLWMLEVLC